jgi:hypothetical protein
MTGDDRVRFCPECNRYVHSLSAMSRAEAEAFLRTDGRVCMRFDRGADGRVLTRTCPASVRTAKRHVGRLLAAVAVGLLLSVALLAGFFGNPGRREEGMAWLRQTKPFQAAREIEPFRTVLEWFDPTPVEAPVGW